MWGAQQLEAIAAVRAWLADPNGKQVFYLAGWAGTGKTTLAKELAGDMKEPRFATFTGKAALVLTGKGCPATTIHALIYSLDEETTRNGDGEPGFKLNLDGPASTADLIVIDEVSMVGDELGTDLMRFKKRILVLGDPGQLPPVDDGVGFFTARPPDFMLTEIHRQAEGNPIIQLATIVRTGGRLNYGAYGTSLVIPRSDMGRKMVARADQVLCGKNNTRRATNTKIRAMLGREGFFAEGEKVVSLRNDKEAGTLNGAIWSVTAVEYSDDKETEMTVRPMDAGMGTRERDVKTHHYWLEGREKELPWRVAREFQPFDYAYCLSVHKAQGSQWDDVLIIDESAAFRENRAKHLYTAITRAAERVTVVL